MLILESNSDLWYRGSKTDKIELNSEGNEADQYGPGIYFTSKFDTAQGYGEVRVYEIDTSKGFFTRKDKVKKPLIVKMLGYVDKEIMETQLSNWDENPAVAKKMLLESICDNKDMPEALQSFCMDACNWDREEFLMVCRAADVNGIILPTPGNSSSSEQWLVLYNLKMAHKRDLGDYPQGDE